MQEGTNGTTGGRYEKRSEDYDTISQGGFFGADLRVTIAADSEDIRDDEQIEVTWGKNLKEGKKTIKGIQYLSISGANGYDVTSKSFSHKMFEGGAGATLGGDDSESDSAKTVFMAIGALGAAFAALTI